MKGLWLDLEMSGDIDDAVVLVFALENRFNVQAVSLLNPSEEELAFTRYWLDFFRLDIPLFTHYDRRIENRNVTHNIIKEFANHSYPISPLKNLSKLKHLCVLGGGSYTVPNILRGEGFRDFVLQGGYAGPMVCATPVLEKFAFKNECSSWNPNLDIIATKQMLRSETPIDFISKDICHDSDIDLDFVKTIKSKETRRFLERYFDGSGKSKKMHDVVALLYVRNPEFIEMNAVVMEEKNLKWRSRHHEGSNKRISTQWNKGKFLDFFAEGFDDKK